MAEHDLPRDIRTDVVQTCPPRADNIMSIICECGYEILIKHHNMKPSVCNNCGRVYYYRIEPVVYSVHVPLTGVQ